MAKPNYIFAHGRRKRAIARVRLFRRQGEILVNGEPINKYFPGAVSQKLLLAPFEAVNGVDKYHATIKVSGSGKVSQLAAVLLGLSNALVKLNAEKFRTPLKKAGLLTRDPRKRERRKVGMGGKSRRKKQSPKR